MGTGLSCPLLMTNIKHICSALVPTGGCETPHAALSQGSCFFPTLTTPKNQEALASSLCGRCSRARPGCSNPVPAAPFFSSVRSDETCDHKVDGAPVDTWHTAGAENLCSPLSSYQGKSSTLLGPQGLFPPSGTRHRSHHRRKAEDMLTLVAHEPLPWQSHEGPCVLLPLFQTLVLKGLTEASQFPSPEGPGLSFLPPQQHLTQGTHKVVTYQCQLPFA